MEFTIVLTLVITIDTAVLKEISHFGLLGTFFWVPIPVDRCNFWHGYGPDRVWLIFSNCPKKGDQICRM